MQDEVNEKVVSLAIKTSKLTAEVLQKAMKALLAKGKGQLTKAPHGKITMRQLSADCQSGKTSESVGSYSVSYASATDRHRESQQEYSRILHLWLGDTGLLYRG